MDTLTLRIPLAKAVRQAAQLSLFDAANFVDYAFAHGLGLENMTAERLVASLRGNHGLTGDRLEAAVAACMELCPAPNAEATEDDFYTRVDEVREAWSQLRIWLAGANPELDGDVVPMPDGKPALGLTVGHLRLIANSPSGPIG